jgi:hypothetical protein
MTLAFIREQITAREFEQRGNFYSRLYRRNV